MVPAVLGAARIAQRLDLAMTEQQLITHWTQARNHIIVAQLGPIFLLTLTIAFLQFGLADAGLPVRIAAAGILLATGVLGALAQIACANEGAAIVRDLVAIGADSALSRTVVASAAWINVVRIGTPALFTVIFVVLLIALFAP